MPEEPARKLAEGQFSVLMVVVAGGPAEAKQFTSDRVSKAASH